MRVSCGGTLRARAQPGRACPAGLQLRLTPSFRVRTRRCECRATGVAAGGSAWALSGCRALKPLGSQPKFRRWARSHRHAAASGGDTRRMPRPSGAASTEGSGRDRPAQAQRAGLPPDQKPTRFRAKPELRIRPNLKLGPGLTRATSSSGTRSSTLQFSRRSHWHSAASWLDITAPCHPVLIASVMGQVTV